MLEDRLVDFFLKTLILALFEHITKALYISSIFPDRVWYRWLIGGTQRGKVAVCAWCWCFLRHTNTLTHCIWVDITHNLNNCFSSFYLFSRLKRRLWRRQAIIGKDIEHIYDNSDKDFKNEKVPIESICTGICTVKMMWEMEKMQKYETF